MLSVRFMKAPPTTYVLHFQNGRVRREGAGLSFFYWAPGSTIVAVPIGSADAPFAFQEATADFQSVAIQGQVTYRVGDPRRLAALLDLSLAPNGGYRTDDYQKLAERLVHATQTLMRAETQRVPLAAALTDASGLGERVLARLRTDEAVVALGVEVLGLAVLAVRPTPESAKALEAEAREALQRRSDPTRPSTPGATRPWSTSAGSRSPSCRRRSRWRSAERAYSTSAWPTTVRRPRAAPSRWRRRSRPCAGSTGGCSWPCVVAIRRAR
jgi:hypothetical protein